MLQYLSIIKAIVAKHDETYHLTYLRFDGGEILLPREDLSSDVTHCIPAKMLEHLG